MIAEAIAAHGLVKRFGAVDALRALDLEVPWGSVLALLGPNGAGKTTTVRVLTTVLDADGGSARVGGHDVAGEPAAVRSSVGLAGQFAAALIHRPPIVFLDEPTAGLDPSSREELWTVIAELVAEDTTVLLTTHHLMARAQNGCDGGRRSKGRRCSRPELSARVDRASDGRRCCLLLAGR